LDADEKIIWALFYECYEEEKGRRWRKIKKKNLGVVGLLLDIVDLHDLNVSFFLK